MSPRPYKTGERRQAATEATRSRILEAARTLLADPNASSFSIDAVAERADVARMTVYYQFKSKGKLLEALFDDFGSRANMREMRKAFQEPNPLTSLGVIIDVFCRLWKSQGALLRRLTALAALDTEVNRALTERGSWRREALTEIVRRLPETTDQEEIVDVLCALTSFETYEMLAARHKRSEKISSVLYRAAAAIYGGF
jgi:AcrR family transcriptional regulator